MFLFGEADLDAPLIEVCATLLENGFVEEFRDRRYAPIPDGRRNILDDDLRKSIGIYLPTLVGRSPENVESALSEKTKTVLLACLIRGSEYKRAFDVYEAFYPIFHKSEPRRRITDEKWDVLMRLSRDLGFIDGYEFFGTFACSIVFQMLTMPVHQFSTTTGRADMSLRDFVRERSLYLRYHLGEDRCDFPPLPSPSSFPFDLLAYVQSWGVERLFMLGWAF